LAWALAASASTFFSAAHSASLASSTAFSLATVAASAAAARESFESASFLF